MNYWWVNQNQTYRDEVTGGFLWSPKTKKDGARNQFYDYMRDVSVGDVIFSFCDTRIKAIGIAVGVAETAPKPDFGHVGTNWSDDGWLVTVEYKELSNQIRPKDHIDLIKPHLPSKYSPLRDTGDGLQSVYLTAVPEPLAHVLTDLIGNEYTNSLLVLQKEVDTSDVDDSEQEVAIKGRVDIGETTKEQLVKSRRGQGVFRANVRLNEKGCRVTGVTDPQHLRASHIKPWKDSNDEEKLNGCNGLLLAPHIDHLFDKGLISFSDAGDLIVSPKLDTDVLNKWSISIPLNVGDFNEEQCLFMKYHRDVVLQK